MTPIAALVAEAIAKAEAEVGPLDDEGNTAGNNGQDDAFMHERTAHIALSLLAARLAEAEGRAERAEAALDAAEREASLRLDRINILRIGFEEGHPVLAVDDAAASERVRKYGPTVVTIDDGMRLAFQQPTPFDYGAGRSVRERVSAENPGARIRLWRLVCIEDWYRLPGEEAPRG